MTNCRTQLIKDDIDQQAKNDQSMAQNTHRTELISIFFVKNMRKHSLVLDSSPLLADSVGFVGGYQKELLD